MTSPIFDLNTHTIDWRFKLRANVRKTIVVIFLFIVLYITFGLLLDFILYIILHQNFEFLNFVNALRELQVHPYITFIMLNLAIFTLLFSLIFPQKLILLGTRYTALNNVLNKSSQEILLENIVDEMTIASSVMKKPAIYILPREDINAFASGFDIESSFIVVTKGLLDKLNRNEIEGIIAHEMIHIKYLDIRLSLIITILTQWMNIVVNSIFNLINSSLKALIENINDDETSMQVAYTKAVILLFAIFFLWPLWVAIIILKIILYPVISILSLYFDRTREAHADIGAVQLLRINEGIGEALIKVENDYRENMFLYEEQLYCTPYENLRFDLYFYDPRLLLNMGKSFLLKRQPSVPDRLKNIGISKTYFSR